MPNRSVGRFVSGSARAEYLESYEAATSALWPMASEESVIETDYGTTFVRRSGSGSGTPLLLLHPLAANGLSWHPLATALSTDRPILAIDMVGTAGRSEQSRPLRAPADFGVWFEQLVDGLDIAEPHLLGYSNGAWHAAAVALTARRPLSSLTLIEPSGVLTGVPLTALIAFFRAGVRPTARSLERLDAVVSPGFRVDAREAALAELAIRTFRARLPWPKVLSDHELRQLTMPVHVLIAQDSALCRPEKAAERMARVIPDARLSVFSGAGHALPFQQQETVTRSVLDFVREHEQR